MAIVPRQPFPWQERGRDEEQVEEPDTVYGAATGGQLWARQPGYMDVLLPPPGFSVWDLPSSKVQNVAVAAAFIATTVLVTCLAGAGLLAILVTGAVVLASVLLLVTVSTGVVALIITGVPVGWAAWQLLSRYRSRSTGASHSYTGWGHED